MPDISSLQLSTIAPVLSTPDTHIFKQNAETQSALHSQPQDDELLFIKYEIQRIITEIREGRWRRIALQFPDHMLPDAPRVSRMLSKGLKQARKHRQNVLEPPANGSSIEVDSQTGPNLLTHSLDDLHIEQQQQQQQQQQGPLEKISILADTSYGACCVDEIAAEHADADVVVHYGRACLSPTLRLPVIHCFTKQAVSCKDVVKAFRDTYHDSHQRIILMSDLPYSHILPQIHASLCKQGYTNLFLTEIVHDTTSALPNRTVPAGVREDTSILQKWSLCHVSEPSPSLLLSLTSKVLSIDILSVNNEGRCSPIDAIGTATQKVLRRRYALLTSLSTVPIFGILVNTLSVRDYMSILRHVKDTISAAGKKSYTFVVGKVNAAKVANFSEVGGWVVIGCWESSLFDSNDFWKPMITPFELGLALQKDSSRVWDGTWNSDFQAILRNATPSRSIEDEIIGGTSPSTMSTDADTNFDEEIQIDTEEESEPPEFDLRTGRYVSHSRPTDRHNGTIAVDSTVNSTPHTSQSLTTRPHGALISTQDAAFPAAAFFRDHRSWQGLGSDYEIAYDHDGIALPDQGAAMEPGRYGIARGYRLGKDGTRT